MDDESWAEELGRFLLVLDEALWFEILVGNVSRFVS